MEITLNNNKGCKTAVLLLVFNRIDTVKEVMNAISIVEPPRLYIAADGARTSKTDEDKKVEEVREYVLNHIDWECEVKTLFREENLGCKTAVSSAIDWFFENEEMGIVLEDDTVPNQSFFYFCEELLNKYKDDTKIMHISGCNFQDGAVIGDGSYYFSSYAHVWGWATWRKAWKKYDVQIKELPIFLKEKKLEHLFNKRATVKYWKNIFSKMYKRKIDTWDYQWSFAIWNNEGISITPNTNFISNVGFGKDATHTKDKSSELSEMPTCKMERIVHPSSITVSQEADLCTEKKFFMNLFSKVIRKVF